MHKHIYIILLFISVFFKAELNAQPGNTTKPEVAASDTFPVLLANKNRLFYVQRTLNKNTIIYDINYNQDSTINQKNPVKIYWVRYPDKGEVEPLSYIQNKYAYGVETALIDTSKMIFKMNFVSYKKRDIYLIKSRSDKNYRSCMTINGKLSYLVKVFVKIEGGTFWFPHITEVEITGADINSGKIVKEKFKP